MILRIAFDPCIAMADSSYFMMVIMDKNIVIQSYYFIMNLQTFLIFLCFIGLISAEIFSRPLKTGYNAYGGLQSFSIQWSSDVDLCSNCIIQLTFSEVIHGSIAPLLFDLYDQTGIIYSQKSSTIAPTSNIYYFPIGQLLNGKKWYLLIIYPSRQPVVKYGSIGMRYIAGNFASAIVYDFNRVIGYYHIQSIALPSNGGITLSFPSAANKNPSQTYPFQILIQSTLINTHPGTITIFLTDQIYSSISPSTPVIEQTTFKFVGNCQIQCDSINCITLATCELIDNKILLTLPSFNVLSYRLLINILNPPFVDSVGIVASVSINSLKTALTIAPSVLMVDAITIIADSVNLHWGIPLATVQSLGLGLFVGGGLNTIDVGFKVSDQSPVGIQLQLKLQVGALHVLEHSINTNLPSLNATTQNICKYQFPNIICSPIDAFTSTSLRYYVKFKAIFAPIDDTSALGSISISILDSSSQLFNPLSQALSIPRITWADYHDYNGFHRSSYRIQDAQVLGAIDSGLANATSTVMDQLFVNSSFVGVDPQMGNQQLIFLLKTLPSQTYASLLGQYKMKVFLNPKIFSKIDKRGIDITAYRQPQNSYSIQGSSCYVNSSTSPTIQIYQCQAHNDHVHGQQIDNTYIQTAQYGVFQFTCGTGQVVVCPVGLNCAQSCRIFKGQGTLTGDSGVFSIRGVQFIPGYQSPYLANDMVFDFIIAFYEGPNLISASLINSFTVKSTRPQLLSLSFVNKYVSLAKINDGSRIPTLLSLDGHLTLKEINGINYDEILLFLPLGITTNNFIQSNNKVGCSHSCSSGTIIPSLMCQDSWMCKQMISIKGVQNIDTLITFKIPVEITNSIFGSIEMGLKKNSQLIKLYRFYGSAVNEQINLGPIEAVSINIFSNPWVSSNYWTKLATDSYNQGLNLNGISDLSSSVAINMNGSTLTYSGTPSFTFTSLHTSILSDFSRGRVNNLKDCDIPFTYIYKQLYEVTVLWCPLEIGLSNQVSILYPYYTSLFGSGFPFQTTFTYGFSDGLGDMIAYRTESNTKSTKSTCSTVHLKNFNYGEITLQEISFNLLLGNIEIGTNIYQSVRIEVAFPSQLPLSTASCFAKQQVLYIDLVCTVISNIANIATVELSYGETISITSVQFQLWVVSNGAATIAPLVTYFYSVSAILPQTDSLLASAFYGTLYSPFSNIVSSCSSFLRLVNFPPLNQQITINNIEVIGKSLNYLSDISFDVSFFAGRNTILPSSQITIIFTNGVTISNTRCDIWTPQQYIIAKSIIAVSSVTLSISSHHSSMTVPTYKICCTNAIITQNTLKIDVQWKDGANILQTSNSLAKILSFLPSLSIGSSILSKRFNTYGFDSQYTIQVSLPTLAGDSVQIWIEMLDQDIHDGVLQCYYMPNTLKQQVYCIRDWENKVHLIFSASSAANIQFSIYGIKQNVVSLKHQILVFHKEISYYRSSFIDTILPTFITNLPILITNEIHTPSQCLIIEIVFPIAYASTFYLQLDDTFTILSPESFVCKVNGIAYTCLRKAPNIIEILSSFSFAAGSNNQIQICLLIPNMAYDWTDKSNIFFRVFTISGSNVAYSSHQHTQILKPALLTNILNPLIWSKANFNQSWIYHKIQYGYYKQPIILSPISFLLFNQNIPLSYTSSSVKNYLASPLLAQMGYSETTIDIASSNFLSVSYIDYLYFTHITSTYNIPRLLPVYVSHQKCIINSQYSLYETYAGGITLPILLDFTHCRPAADHFFSYSMNSAELIVDQTMSSKLVNSTLSKAFIFVRQAPTNSLLNGLFSLQIIFSGVYMTSFTVVAAVNIKVNSGTILSIPNSLKPVIQSGNSSFINFTVQCNQPSTIYWAIGLYPTVQTMTYQMVQSKLNSQVGMRDRVRDPYSWSEQLYGMDYEYYPNKNKTILITDLKGNRNYIFKYFCVNQLGFPSSGQIINYTTGYSNFGLNKVRLEFINELTIYQANQISCYISEVLLTPYKTVTTSSFSNCFNVSYVYYTTDNTKYHDQVSNGKFVYYFYVNSETINNTFIRYNLPLLLPKYKKFIESNDPFQNIAIFNLVNSNKPQMRKTYVSSGVNTANITVDVGVANSYLIMAYMQSVFDPQTMSLPTHYLMKQGIFSSISHFKQVYMKYGRSNISLTIQGLEAQKDYSIFYFVTVDNPALNSRSTQIYYQNIRTFDYIIYRMQQYYIVLGMVILSMIWLV